VAGECTGEAGLLWVEWTKKFENFLGNILRLSLVCFVALLGYK